MAKARQIVKRRKSVQSVRKITQTMQLIATARFQKCFQRASATKPYTQNISEMISTLAGASDLENKLLAPNVGVVPSEMLIITSNRGLCGSYNANVVRLAIERLRALQREALAPELTVVGKRGFSFLRFLGLPVKEKILDIEDRIEYARVADIAERLMARYEAGEIARVDVAFTRFVSAGTQRAEVIQLLPIEPPRVENADSSSKERVSFEFSPEPSVLLAHLLPEAVKVRLFQCFNDSIASEQVARMIAMKAATDAAGDLIKDMSRAYNRARQSQITSELADIIGGAEAIK